MPPFNSINRTSSGQGPVQLIPRSAIDPNIQNFNPSGISVRMPNVPGQLSAPGQNLGDVRGRIASLLGTIRAAFGDLISAGRENEAAQLRESAERFANAGSKLGVNAFARAQALNDLKSKMRVAGRLVEAQAIGQRLAMESQTLNNLANVDQAEFNQGLQAANFAQRANDTAFNQAQRQQEVGFQQDVTARDLNMQRIESGRQSRLARAQRNALNEQRRAAKASQDRFQVIRKGSRPRGTGLSLSGEGSGRGVRAQNRFDARPEFRLARSASFGTGLTMPQLQRTGIARSGGSRQSISNARQLNFDPKGTFNKRR